MSDPSSVGLPDAARRLGVSIRALRQAVRAGRVPAPPRMGATAKVPAEWVMQAEAAVAASPRALRMVVRPKVPAFARYEGTSAWRKYHRRVREYAHHCAAMEHASQG